MDSYQATVYQTALGDVRQGRTKMNSREVFIVGPQECTHHLTVRDAKQVIDALTQAVAEIERERGW